MSQLDLVSLEKSIKAAPRGFQPTVVVKVGTSSILRERINSAEAWENPATAAGEGLRGTHGELALSTLALIVDTLIALKRAGFWVVLVTSGAVGVGCRRLSISKRPNHTSAKAALAAVGMGRLIHHYEELFAMANEATALILVSRSDFGKKSKFSTIQNTLLEIFKLGVVPIINENDTVTSEDLKFGDNDRLSALVSGMVNAKYLFLLTDVDMLYTANPRTNPEAVPITDVAKVEDLEVNLGEGGKGGTQWGTGGMETKITAAKLATACGANVVIIHGRKPERILDWVLEREEKIGTIFRHSESPVSSSRKLWILHGLVPSGSLYVDNGAKNAIFRKKSLFAAGIKKVRGAFHQDSAVRIFDMQEQEIGRGLVNYDIQDLSQIIGCKSEEIEKILGEPGPEEVIHRDNLVVFYH